MGRRLIIAHSYTTSFKRSRFNLLDSITFLFKSIKALVIDDSLDKIASEVALCRLCILFRTRTQAVPGEGSSILKVVLIGEAPGRSEDNLGKPFIGKAGNILDYVLNDSGISRSQVYVTNIVKCRPP